MARPFRIPFIIFWLLVKDFFYNVDVCDSSNNEPGHCLSNSECSKIGTNIGSCDSESSGLVCCKITLNYFNKTYLLKQIFVRKSQTDVVREMVIFSSNSPCGQSILEYGNRSINLKKKEKVYFNPEVHVSETPDRIIWPIWASYSRQSRDLKKQSSGTNHLYVVELYKLVVDERDNKSHPVSECLSESDENDKYYTLLNPEKRFLIRKFFAPKMQKFNTMNLTIHDSSSIEDVEAQKRSRRSVNLGVDNTEDLSCGKQQWEDVLNVKHLKRTGDIQSELRHNFFKEMDNSGGDHKKNIDSVINNALKSKVITKGQMKHEESSSDKKNADKIKPDIPFVKEQFPDSSINSKDLEEKRTIEFQEITLFNKIPVKGDSRYVLNRPSRQSVYNNKQSQENEAIYDFRKPVQVEATHNMRNPVQLEAFHDMRKPVQMDETHDMRKPVQVDETHNMQKSVKKESSHDMRRAVQNNVDHNMRKPVETGRGFVQREGTHDMRKPVTSDESHDLRWPVLEGENDLRNSYTESDAYDKVNSNLDCKVDISLFSNKISSTENTSERIQKQEQLQDIWEEAFRVCGKYNGGIIRSSSNKTEEKWPWMVSLHENISGRYKHKCSASLLNSLWVITVAHCVDMKPKTDILLVLGSQNAKDGKENVIERAIDEIVVHPKFNRGLFENDLALLRMKTPVAFQSAVSPICLPWNVEEITHGIPVFLAWRLKYQRTSDDLQNLTVPIMTNYECEVLYSTGKNKEAIKDTFLCAAKDDRNCDSESGSSLIAQDSEGRWSLIGLVSWGSTCTNPEQPGVYIRISSYAQWIKDVIDCYEILM